MAESTAASCVTLVGIPHEVASMVGRRRERTDIRQALSESRLVTLTGFGGIGKTRLALAVAPDLRRAFADGVHFVSLGSLADPEMIPQVTARTLGMRTVSQQSPADSLVAYLGSRQVLIVFDNCEHLIEAVAVFAQDLLWSCPRLRILATSREPLRITGEAVHAVAPLTVPATGAEARSPHYSESEALFLDRARAVVPNFALTPGNRDEVSEICRLLEGIPLAIELAAVRLRSMSASQIARDLADHWGPLSRGSRTAPARQRTMTACIDWSFSLCSPTERDVWAGVSVFAGGFEVDAAQAVCARLAGEEELADVIAALVDKSIIAAEERAGQMRFRLLPPIRHRGLRRLAEMGLTGELRRRHRDWYADLTARASEEQLSPRQVDWIERLGREERNLQAALEALWRAKTRS
jgi:predicted ATPase